MATTRATTKKVHFLRTYRFNKTAQDPIIDRIRTCAEDVGYDIARIAKESGVAYATLAKWFDGTTRRPQFCTTAAAIRGMGFDFAVVPANKQANGNDVKASMPDIIKRFRVANK